MKKIVIFGLLVMLLLSVTVTGIFASGAKEEKSDEKIVLYWVSHGAEGDPIWVYAINGAQKAADTLGVKLNASFHSNDIATQKEAINAAIAAGADGIATTSPAPGALKEEAALAKAKGIPFILFNSDDPTIESDAYVGASLTKVGADWAQYLVDKKLVKSGDFVWCPVEVPGASYQVDEIKGIGSVFDPLGITYEVFDATVDAAQSISNMTDYLTAHGDKVDAMIGLGDMVMGNTRQVFNSIGWKAGEIPVVGWGNSNSTAKSVKDGYVNAATWQYPSSLGVIPITLLYMANVDMAIGYDVITLGLYDKSNVDTYIELTAGM